MASAYVAGIGWRSAAYLVATLTAIALAIVYPQWLLVAGFSVLPLFISIHLPVGTTTVGEVCLGIAGLSLLVRNNRAGAAVAAAWPLAAGFGFYLVTVGLPLLSGMGTASALLQRSIVVALAVTGGLGLAAGGPRLAGYALKGYILGSCGLAVLWILNWSAPQLLGINKNPGGQVLANAFLIWFAFRWRSWWCLAGLACAVGVLATGSRGAILALVAGALTVAVLLSVGRKRLVKMLAVVVVGLVAAVTIAPKNVSSFVARYTGTHTLDQRDLLREYALSRWHLHPAGFGPGSFEVGVRQLSWLQTPDPHNVVVLTLYEGGVVALVGFAVWILLPTLLALRSRAAGRSLAALAVALSVSVVVHVMLDVYWVRTTPTLSIAILAAVLASRAITRADVATFDGDARSSSRANGGQSGDEVHLGSTVTAGVALSSVPRRRSPTR
jgi:hypothetical protein